MATITVGRTVFCRYNGYHRSGEDFNPAIVTHVEQGGDPDQERTIVELTIVARGTVPFPATGIEMKAEDTGEDRICWFPPRV
jgi:hypothetical protein